MTLFAYQRIASSIENQSLRREIAFCKIDPAYTSQMGKFLFMRRYGMSIHQAAAYTIGLVGMGLYDKLAPDLRMLQKHFQVFKSTSSTERFRMKCWKRENGQV